MLKDQRRIRFKWSREYRSAGVFFLMVFAACSPSERKVIGVGGGPYEMNLFLKEENLVVGREIELAFQLSDSRSGKIVENLQLAHERLMHIFVTDERLEDFDHLHVKPQIENEVDSKGRFLVKHAFEKSGVYQVVAEFVHRNRIWNKSFKIVIDDSNGAKSSSDPSRKIMIRDKYTALLMTPEKIVSGKEVELMLEVKRDGLPVQNLQLFLGSELHGAVWRDDLKNFGHLHSFTPKMKKLIEEIRMREKRDNISPSELQEVLVEVMCGNNELIFSGPSVPLRYTFPAPGKYRLFAEIAPNGIPKTFSFNVEVGFPDI